MSIEFDESKTVAAVRG